MIVYRISNESYKDDISGNGAAIYGARWNSVHVKMLYTGQHISLCILESLVHLRKTDIPDKQYLLTIQIPEGGWQEIMGSRLKKDWQQQAAYTQWIGDNFISSGEKLILKVPSVVVPQENNYLVNPLHPGYKKVKLVKSELLEFDKRLLQNLP